MKIKHVLYLVVILFWCEIAGAGEKTAVVHGDHRKERGRFVKVECSMRLESVLRDAGYRSISRGSRSVRSWR